MANPHLERCPDYMLPEFQEARFVFTVDGKTEEEAAAYLRSIWQINHDRAVEPGTNDKRQNWKQNG